MMVLLIVAVVLIGLLRTVLYDKLNISLSENKPCVATEELDEN